MALLLFSLEEVISIISEKNFDLLEEQTFPPPKKNIFYRVLSRHKALWIISVITGLVSEHCKLAAHCSSAMTKILYQHSQALRYNPCLVMAHFIFLK